MKIHISDDAINAIKGVITLHSDMPANVRVFMSGSSCSGPSFGLGLDHVKEGDLPYEQDDVNFIIERRLYNTYGEFKIESTPEGFIVGPVRKTETATDCSSCGGSCH